jgi:hypothetical protein
MQVVNASKFEGHAGMGHRRAPYDNVYTLDESDNPVDSLKSLAARLPANEVRIVLPGMKRGSRGGGVGAGGGDRRPRVAPTLRRRAQGEGAALQLPEVNLPELPLSDGETEEGAQVFQLMHCGMVAAALLALASFPHGCGCDSFDLQYSAPGAALRCGT